MELAVTAILLIITVIASNLLLNWLNGGRS